MIAKYIPKLSKPAKAARHAVAAASQRVFVGEN
jgi:hypothetical protein